MKKQDQKVEVASVPAEVVVQPEKPKYAKTMDNTIGRREAASEQVLVKVAPATPREGTARAAAYAALVASVGQPEPAVLAAVAEAERAWHRTTNRAPKAVSPAGWLRTFKAEFKAATPAAK